MKLVNLDNDCIIAEHIHVADRFLNRLKGLMFTDSLPSDCGLHLRPCRGIHTFFMQFNIDVLHLDSRYQVVGIEENLQPGQRGKIFPQTEEIVELSAGRVKETGTKIGHRVKFQMETNL